MVVCFNNDSKRMRWKYEHPHDMSELPTTAFFEIYEMKVLLPAPVIPNTAVTVSSGL